MEPICRQMASWWLEGVDGGSDVLYIGSEASSSKARSVPLDPLRKELRVPNMHEN